MHVLNYIYKSINPNWSNNMKKRILSKVVSLLVIAPLIFVFSCQTDKKRSTTFEEASTAETVIYPDDGTSYKIPSPLDLFQFLEQNGASFVKEAMNNPEKKATYLSRKTKSLNLGIYSADLAYSTVFSDFQQTLLYFSAAKTLATDLGLHEGFGEQMAERIDQNLTNVDSLINISADSYEEATLFLEDQGQTDILGLIVVGGWIESLYLSIQSVGRFNAQNPLIERIADQQILLENLMDYLKKYTENNQILEVVNQLEELQEIFDQLYYNDETTFITQEQFVAISNKTTEIRESFIN